MKPGADIVTGCGLDGEGIEDRYLAGTKDSLLHSVKIGSKIYLVT
jgi:hypothetical protein